MEDVLKMDIFFVVTTGAVVIITVFFCTFLFFAIRLVRTAERVGKIVEKEALVLRDTVDDMRLTARKEIGHLFALISSAREFLARFMGPKLPRE